MASTPGVSATLFNALATANINLRAIAQGCSEYNITVIVKREECVRALRAVHSQFYLSRTTIALGIVGPGLIGGTLLDQLSAQVLRYVGVVDVVNRKGTVELGRYKKNHPFAQLSGSDNIIAFTTERYNHQPLIVRGPRAGAQVTAGGVFSDILGLSRISVPHRNNIVL